MEEASWWARPEEAFTLDEKLLACGAAVVSRMRAAVRAELQYSCTAGEMELQGMVKSEMSGEGRGAHFVHGHSRMVMDSGIPKLSGWREGGG